MKIRRLLAILLTLMLVLPGGIAESPGPTGGDIAAVAVDLPETPTQGEIEIAAPPTEAGTQEDDTEIAAAPADPEVPEAGELSLEDLGDAPADSGLEAVPEVPAAEVAEAADASAGTPEMASAIPADAPVTEWAALQQALDAAEGTVVLDRDYRADSDAGDEALVVNGSVTLDLNGHTIDRNLADAVRDGNVITVNGALTLRDSAGGGMITGGNNPVDGGGVIVYGTFSMTGGAITGNMCNCGGGVYATEGGAFALSGGSITGNIAVANGGGVFVGEAAFDMTGGLIENNLAQDDSGGGVFAGEFSVFGMTGGRIAGNAAGSGGGGVFVFGMEDTGGAFELSGGAITGNTAPWGGGVYVDCDARFALSGAPDISGNTRDGAAPDNVFLYRDGIITVAGKLTCAAPIGVITMAKPDPEDGLVTLTDGLRECGGDIALFQSDDDGCVLGWNGEGSEAALGLAIRRSVTGYEGVYDGTAHGITVAVTAPESGYTVKYGTEEGQYTLDESPTYTDAGVYTVYCKVSARGYHDVAGSATVNIARAPLTVTADARSKTEGEAVPGDFSLLPVAATAGPTSVTLGWTPMPGADGYDVFFARCGKNSACQVIASVPADAPNSWSVTGLKTGTAYKCYVMAWRIENGVRTYIDRASPTVHAIAGGENRRYCNAKEVTAQKAALTVKVGGRRRIRASVRGVAKGKRVLKHARKLRYYSSDRGVAVVDGRGRVRGVRSGVCTVYAVANNGMRTAVTVTVQ